MRIGILSYRLPGQRFAYEEVRILKTAREMGYKANIYRVYDCELYYNGTGPAILYKGKVFPDVNVIIPRVSVLTNIDLRASIVRQFEYLGVPVLNGYKGILQAKNKLKTLQILSHYGLPIPSTVVISQPEDLKDAIKRVGGAPVIIKSPFGSLGSGVMIAESYRAAVSASDFFGTRIILIQEYVKESKGKDTRVFVVGGKVVAAMERAARKGEFRSNAALGGKGKIVSLSKEYEDLALKATELLDLEVAGVDILTTKKGPLILEVNSNPGFEELEIATHIDVAKAIVERAVDLPVA